MWILICETVRLLEYATIEMRSWYVGKLKYKLQCCNALINHRSAPTNMITKLKVKQSRNRPDVAQKVPGGLDFHISMTFGIWRCWGCQRHAPAAFIPRKCSWYSFSLRAESIPGPWYGRKEYVTEKYSDTTGNRSWDRPTSTAAP